jgi:hypothetical protein
MIAIASETGSLIRLLSAQGSFDLGFHPSFGFITKESLVERNLRRKKQGLHVKPEAFSCQLRLIRDANGAIRAQAMEGCQVEEARDGRWQLSTTFGKFWIGEAEVPASQPILGAKDERDTAILYSLLAASLILVLFLLPTSPKVEDVPIILEEPVTVKVIEPQRSVKVPESQSLARMESKAANNLKSGGAAVAQNLGFLSLLGKKDLKKAMGGMPTEIKDASAGAGSGGLKGSGGELLVGLGQGVKRTTVGNSGVSGLGGIGTGGKGGGAGGYGNSLVGSGGTGTGLNGIGEGKRLSAMALSQDIVLEGGLDRAVIQATIAKYISQVRACYEEGLRSSPGLSGQVTMGFEIGPKGNLNYSKVAKSSLGHGGVESCIAERMMTWKFPEPLGGVNVKVVYPFLLRPVRS